MRKDFKPGKIEILLAALFCGLFIYQAVLGIYANSITFDEPVYLSGGMNILRNSDYRFNSEAVVLPQLLEAFPAAVSKAVTFPDLADSRTFTQWYFAENYIYGSENDSDFILYSGRFVVLVISLLAGIAVYFWSRKLFGVKAALLSLFLFSFSPTILAHSGIAASDMITSFFFLISLFLVWRMMKKITLFSVLSASFSLGLLFLSKYSAFFFIFVFIGMIAVRIFSANPIDVSILKFKKVIVNKYIKLGSLICCSIVNGIIIFAMIWAFYSFRYSMDNPESPMENKALVWSCLPDASPLVKAVKSVAARHILPEAYLYGFAYTYAHSSNRTSFLNGSYSDKGCWYFFLYAFLVKTNPGLLVILLLSIFIFIKRRKLFYKIIPFLIFIAVYMFFAMTGKMNIGHRHILPVYPMLFIIAGAASTLINFKRGFLIAAPVLLACFWTLSASLSVSPYYLAYFNFIAGGPSKGYKHLVDSSLDWGQGLAALKSYIDENQLAGKKVYLSKIGSVSTEKQNMKALLLPAYFNFTGERIFDFKEGLYCISATMYQLVYYPELARWPPEMDAAFKPLLKVMQTLMPLVDGQADFKNSCKTDKNILLFLRNYSNYRNLAFAKIVLYLHETKRIPDAMPGYSILVFDLSDEEVREALSRPSVPIRHQ